MNLIDTHCHLDFEVFSEDLNAIIKRAQSAGVDKMITISTRMSKLSNLLQITDTYECVSCSVGVHPCEVGEEGVIDIQDILMYANHPKVVGIGETGLDYFHDASNAQAQLDSFMVHIDAARKSKLPVIIHSRNADDDMAFILEREIKNGSFKGVLHCFTGSMALAEKAIELGLYISISGIITFKSARELIGIVDRIPLNRLLIETDAPYLAPAPFRGKRNEPAYVTHTHQKLADIKKTSVEDFAKITRENSFRLFPKLDQHNQDSKLYLS
ncbi:MAG: TatD family hydrolase [Thalassobaculaceae bacterium]